MVSDFKPIHSKRSALIENLSALARLRGFCYRKAMNCYDVKRRLCRILDFVRFPAIERKQNYKLIQMQSERFRPREQENGSWDKNAKFRQNRVTGEQGEGGYDE
jgi:hypothetical protein